MTLVDDAREKRKERTKNFCSMNKDCNGSDKHLQVELLTF